MAPVARGLLCGAAALQAALCVAWTAANLGDVPHYGDSVEYLSLAERGRVDEYRGFLYPALLRAAGSALGARPWSLRFEDRSQAARGRCAAPGALAVVQGAQLGLCAALLAYFLYVLLPGLAPRGAGRRARAGVLGILLVLLLSDPLVTHFQASVLTDGLALAGSLAFCAALADARVGRTPTWLAMLLLFASTVLVAGLRVEKSAVLAATGAASVALGAVWRRRDVPGAGRRDALRIALPLAAGLALALAAQQASTASQGRWPRATAIRHERIVFQNLRAVYPQLPERVRRVLSREQARLYDRRIARVRDVMTEISGGDPARLESLTRDMTAVVLRERWPRVLLDVATDTAENLAATVSFYARVLAWQVLGDARYFAWSRSEGTRWTYEMLALHHPRLSAAYVASGALLFLVASGLALGRARVALGRARARRRTGRGGLRAGAWLPFAPLACFCALNAALFATAADLVHIRYALPAHVALLTLVYAAALRGVRGDVAPDSRFPRDAATASSAC